MGAEGALNVAPKAPFPRLAREIPLKVGISRVEYNVVFWLLGYESINKN